MNNRRARQGWRRFLPWGKRSDETIIVANMGPQSIMAIQEEEARAVAANAASSGVESAGTATSGDTARPGTHRNPRAAILSAMAGHSPRFDQLHGQVELDSPDAETPKESQPLTDAAANADSRELNDLDERPSASEPRAADSGGAEHSAAESDLADPLTSGAAEPDAAEPDAAEPDAAEPDAAERDAAGVDVAEPLATEPLATEPLAAEPIAAEEPVAAAPAANAFGTGADAGAHSHVGAASRDVADRSITDRSAGGSALAGGVFNALTIDVEDWFQIPGLTQAIDPAEWTQLEPRLDRNLTLLLRLMARHRVKATFFVSSWAAERHAARIREIAAQGHEIACQGPSHRRLTDYAEDEFRRELAAHRDHLQQLSGQRVIGYRAVDFSLTTRTPWARAAIADQGFLYSSSLRPYGNDIAGDLGATRNGHGEPGLIEIPPSFASVAGARLLLGGDSFRWLPYAVTASAVRRLNDTEHIPAVFYLPSWSIDMRQPRIRQAPLLSRIRHYTNLDYTLLRLDRLLSDFRWASMRDVFDKQLPAAPADITRDAA